MAANIVLHYGLIKSSSHCWGSEIIKVTFLQINTLGESPDRARMIPLSI